MSDATFTDDDGWGGPRRGPGRRGGARSGGPSSGGHRARRGAVRDAIVLLLAERPMHGYELITELESRTGGRWRPSPGAVYPALEKLERHALIVATDDDGKRQFALTDDGRQVAEALQGRDGEPAPWEEAPSERGETRRLIAEIAGQIRQIARFGNSGQRAAANSILERTKRDLYTVLADPGDAAEDAPAPPGSADEPTPGT